MKTAVGVPRWQGSPSASSSSGRRRSRTTSFSETSTRAQYSARSSSSERSATSAFSTSCGCSRRSRCSRRCGSTHARRGVHEGVGSGPIGTGMLLGMLGLAIVWLRQPAVPADRALVGVALRHHGRALRHLAARGLTLLGAQFVSVCLALLIVMGPRAGWATTEALPGAAVFVGIAALFTFVSPYIDYTTEPLRDEDLIEAAELFRERARPPGRPRLRPGGESRHRTGQRVRVRVGPTRRIVFWDTVLTGFLRRR